jgi:hypothetical protein
MSSPLPLTLGIKYRHPANFTKQYLQIKKIYNYNKKNPQLQR